MAREEGKNLGLPSEEGPPLFNPETGELGEAKEKGGPAYPLSTWYRASLLRLGESGKLKRLGIDGGDSKGKSPKKKGKTAEVSDEVRSNALELLAAIDEYYQREDSEGKKVRERGSLTEVDDLTELDKMLSSGLGQPEEGEAVSAKGEIKQKIKTLLETEGVKEYFFTLLKKEEVSFRKAKPTLKQVSFLQKLKDKIIAKITPLYLDDKRKYGKLLGSTATAISNLENKRDEADRIERSLRASADEQTRSWLMVQELLQHKQELKESGFAKTESRKRLIERVLMDIAHGNKVFLVGSTGTGKTQLAMLVADLINDEGFEIVSWHEGTTPRDLFGYREVWQDEGGIKSGTKKGPVALSIVEGKIVIHDEYTGGTTRAQLSAKAQMNARVGKTTNLPGFNGQVFTVKEGYGEIFTGNPRDERTKAREDMDPAILRMLRGLKVPYMPADELFKIILAEIIDDTGLLPLSRAEVALVKKLTQAAELMQMCHDREVEKLKGSQYEDSIKQIFGGTLEEVHLDKSFLDTGTILRIFKGWDLERARGQSFAVFLRDQLTQFIGDPKFDIDKEEKKLAKTILGATGLDVDKSFSGKRTEDGAGYILPSEIGKLFHEKIEDNPLDDDDDHKGNPEDVKDLDSKLEKLVNSQYEGAINLLKMSGLYDPSENNHPSKEKVKALLASNINPEQLEVIGKMENPVLQIVPNRTCAEYETALNGNKPMNKQVDALVSDWMRQAFGRADTRDHKINSWKIVITEGSDAPTLLEGDDTGKTLGERCSWFESEFKDKGVTGIDIKSYTLLMMAGFLKELPRPVDGVQGADKTWTMLNAEEIFMNAVAGAIWDDNARQVYLSEDPTVYQYAGARFRASVVVDVPSS